jgi:hypothetical protein
MGRVNADAGCINCNRCLFRDFVSGRGGAIFTDEGVTNLSVSETTFVVCHANDYGGAICSNCPDWQIGQCCRTNCSSPHGQFLSFGGSNLSPRFLSFLTILTCALASQSPPTGQGVIFVDQAITLRRTFSNISVMTF